MAKIGLCFLKPWLKARTFEYWRLLATGLASLTRGLGPPCDY